MSAWVLGVDIGSGWAAGAGAALGTVSGAASGARPDVLVVGGDRRVPCTVVLTEDGRLLSGAFAHRAARRLPDRAERDPRRYAGRSPMLLGGTPVAAGDALAALLALFVAEGRRRHDGRDPVRVALTHPAGWPDDRLAALRAAAARVVPGAEVLLVPEPVAVTAHDTAPDPARGTTRDPAGDAGREAAGPARGPGALAVLDVGATSFDVAVVVPGAERPEAAASDPDLGGELFDQLVLHALGEQLAHSAPGWWREVSTNPDRTWLAAAADLAEEARLAREARADCDADLDGLGRVKPFVRDGARFLSCLYDEPTLIGVADRSRVSDHPRGLALDLMVRGERGDRIAECALANQDELGVSYVIWEQRVNYGDGWEGMSDRGGDTENHFDHVHISFEGSGGSGDPVVDRCG